MALKDFYEVQKKNARDDRPVLPPEPTGVGCPNASGGCDGEMQRLIPHVKSPQNRRTTLCVCAKCGTRGFL